MRTLNIFDQDPIDVDEDITVGELSQKLVDEVGLWVDDARYATLYDSESDHVCCDPDRRVGDEIKGSDVFPAYVIPGVFYFVEGGWGKRMLEMDCRDLVPEPMCIRVVFDEFDHFLVVNGGMTVGQLAGAINGHILIGEEITGCAVGEYGVMGTMLLPRPIPGETPMRDLDGDVFLQIEF